MGWKRIGHNFVRWQKYSSEANKNEIERSIKPIKKTISDKAKGHEK